MTEEKKCWYCGEPLSKANHKETVGTSVVHDYCVFRAQQLKRNKIRSYLLIGVALACFVAGAMGAFGEFNIYLQRGAVVFLGLAISLGAAVLITYVDPRK